MSENGQNWSAIGNQIKDAVQEALTTGDFSQLNNAVQDTTEAAIEEARRFASNAAAAARENTQAVMDQSGFASGQFSSAEQSVGSTERSASGAGSSMPRKPFKRIGRVSGILYTVFGGMGVGIMGISLAVLLIVATEVGFISGLNISMLIIGLFLILSIVLLELGCVKRQRLKRAEQYVSFCGGRSYINIEDLAAHIGRSREFVVKDVKKMIQIGILPEGHLDEQEKVLMINNAIFKEYLKLVREHALQEKNKTPETELDGLVRVGHDYIRRLREQNDLIEGEVISAKLFRLENILKEIFARIKEHPEQLSQMQKFMDYYLPTTLELVEKYADFDHMSAPGPDVLQAKQEIEKTLDTINHAFEELLNKLFMDDAFDATTDAQVLKTMLAREGLTKEPVFIRNESN